LLGNRGDLLPAVATLSRAAPPLGPGSLTRRVGGWSGNGGEEWCRNRGLGRELRRRNLCGPCWVRLVEGLETRGLGEGRPAAVPAAVERMARLADLRGGRQPLRSSSSDRCLVTCNSVAGSCGMAGSADAGGRLPAPLTGATEGGAVGAAYLSLHHLPSWVRRPLILGKLLPYFSHLKPTGLLPSAVDTPPPRWSTCNQFA
jgi:hypothetical protein